MKSSLLMELTCAGSLFHLQRKGLAFASKNEYHSP